MCAMAFFGLCLACFLSTTVIAIEEGGIPVPVVRKDDVTNYTYVTVNNQTYELRPLHEGPYSLSRFSITCCRNGTPSADASLEPHINEWSHNSVQDERDAGCRRFDGYYSLPTEVTLQKNLLTGGVRCKCPEVERTDLDRNCRYLPDCANGGYRSFSINLRCVCTSQWFGERCEKFCLNGLLYKEEPDGWDQCKCVNEHFYGEMCDQVLCYNGGTPVKGRACLCPQQYVGAHCEHSNDNGLEGSGADGSAHSATTFHRDLSGTVVSLFLAVALALGVYFLVRRRTRWMRNRLRMRRAIMGGGEEESGVTRSTTANSGFSAAVPPPFYFARSPMTAVPEVDINGLPPPPAYSDVVKSPPAYVEAQPAAQASPGANVPTPNVQAESVPENQGNDSVSEASSVPTQEDITETSAQDSVSQNSENAGPSLQNETPTELASPQKITEEKT